MSFTKHRQRRNSNDWRDTALEVLIHHDSTVHILYDLLRSTAAIQCDGSARSIWTPVLPTALRLPSLRWPTCKLLPRQSFTASEPIVWGQSSGVNRAVDTFSLDVRHGQFSLVLQSPAQAATSLSPLSSILTLLLDTSALHCSRNPRRRRRHIGDPCMTQLPPQELWPSPSSWR